MSANAAAVLQDSARRMFPDLDLDQVLAELLLERAQKNLVKYQTLARQFEVKYQQDFASFRQHTLSSQPTAETEQDYFDWELAITGIADMTEEIKRLRSLSQPA
jgi:hypothetical protein